MGHREELLQAAIECLEQKGYARTTARDLVAASGTNLASIGYHYGSKEALLNEAIGECFRRWTEQLGAVAFADESASPLERLSQSLIAMVEGFEENRALMVAVVEALAQAERSPELREQMAAYREESRARIAEMVESALEGRARGGGVDSDIAASLLMAICDGLVVQWLLSPERAPSGSQVVATFGAALGALADAERAGDRL
jgi:AcrR family transcriptional regulator